ncbi:MAG: diaminopimelate epimerase [Proteobacteria bacterium]|nr:diaminopimelate epimerase [Pseudomonadota bacterium]
MNTSFTKYSANGNHFILFDEMQESACITAQAIQDWCHPTLGIGADGVASLSPHTQLDFTFRLWNSDGGEAEMCGNAARAAAFHYLTHHSSKKEVRFKTMNAEYLARLEGERLWLEMSEKTENTKLDPALFKSYLNFYSADTGVPHLVLQVSDVEKVDLMKEAPLWRFHKMFERGTNVDFISVPDKTVAKVFLRVYERGVEGETWSCGTGVAAVGWACKKFFGWSSDISVVTKGGEHRIRFVNEKLWYSGAIKLVFKGQL